MSIGSPSETRIETTSTPLCSPITVIHCVLSRSAPEAGDVIRMKVRIDGLDEFEIEIPQKLNVAIDLLEHGIDDECLSAAAAREQISIGARCAVEQLAKDHGLLLGTIGPHPATPQYTACRAV